MLSKLIRHDARPPLPAYVEGSRAAWNATLRELRALPLDRSKCSSETWESTITREFFTHIAERAAYVLEAAMQAPAANSAYLLEAAQWFEFCRAHDANMTTPGLKNAGLAHVHLVRSKEGKVLPFVPDVLGASRLLGDVGFSRLHPTAATPEWRTWASTRFQTFWGDFLTRPDAKNDPQYDTIKGLYLKVISHKSKGIDARAA